MMTYNTLIQAIRQHINGTDCDGCPFENMDCPDTEEFALMAADAIEAIQEEQEHGKDAV